MQREMDWNEYPVNIIILILAIWKHVQRTVIQYVFRPWNSLLQDGVGARVLLKFRKPLGKLMEEETIKGYCTIIPGITVVKSLLQQYRTAHCKSIAFQPFDPSSHISSWWLLELYVDLDRSGVSPKLPIIMFLGCVSQCLDHNVRALFEVCFWI